MLYIYIYIYTHVLLDTLYVTHDGDVPDVALRLSTRVRKEPVRFDSFRVRTFRQFICSARFGSVRPVRFGRFGSVSYSFLSRLTHDVRAPICCFGSSNR